MNETFNGTEISITDFDDASSGEHVLEFRDPLWNVPEPVLAIAVPDQGTWKDAILSINPSKGDIDVAFAAWAIKIAEQILNDTSV